MPPRSYPSRWPLPIPPPNIPKPPAVPQQKSTSAPRSYGDTSFPARPTGVPYYGEQKAENAANQVLDDLLGSTSGGTPFSDLLDAVKLMAANTQSGGSGIDRKKIADAINRMVAAARGAQTEIGTAYGAAGSQLDKLMQDYAAAAAAQRQGAGQTLQAFGVNPAQVDVGGMTPQDLLVAQKANLIAQQAAQQAAISDRIAGYQTLLGA